MACTIWFQGSHSGAQIFVTSQLQCQGAVRNSAKMGNGNFLHTAGSPCPRTMSKDEIVTSHLQGLEICVNYLEGQQELQRELNYITPSFKTRKELGLGVM